MIVLSLRVSAWGYGFIFVSIINVCSLGGAIVLPFMKSSFYKHILMFMLGLAVGSLAGSGLLFLIPEVHHVNLLFQNLLMALHQFWKEIQTRREIIMKYLVLICSAVNFSLLSYRQIYSIRIITLTDVLMLMHYRCFTLTSYFFNFKVSLWKFYIFKVFSWHAVIVSWHAVIVSWHILGRFPCKKCFPFDILH